MVVDLVSELSANRLLAALSDHDRTLLAQQMEIFDLSSGAILQRAGDVVVDTWFPCGPAIASFRVELTQGEPVEVAIVGREGAVGGIVSNGAVPAFATAEVYVAGRFLRIKTATLERMKLDSVALRHWFARYSDCLLAQLFQSAACNSKHTILQRACKWFLAVAERTESPELTMTQEELAMLLGVGRPFINRVVNRLRADGAIVTQRGRIRLNDMDAIKHAACECSTAVESHFDKVLKGIYD